MINDRLCLRETNGEKDMFRRQQTCRYDTFIFPFNPVALVDKIELNMYSNTSLTRRYCRLELPRCSSIETVAGGAPPSSLEAVLCGWRRPRSMYVCACVDRFRNARANESFAPKVRLDGFRNDVRRLAHSLGYDLVAY